MRSFEANYLHGNDIVLMKSFYYLLILLLFISCKPKQEDVLPWLNRNYIEGNITVVQIPFHFIKEEYKNDYINKLNKDEYIILNEADYYLLTGKVLEKRIALAVRGICSRRDREAFAVFITKINNDLLIKSYAVNGFDDSEKAVLIVEIDEMPENIFNNLPSDNMVRQVPKLPEVSTKNTYKNNSSDHLGSTQTVTNYEGFVHERIEY